MNTEQGYSDINVLATSNQILVWISSLILSDHIF